MNKNASYNKVLREEIKFLKRKIKFLYKSKTTAIGKIFMKNQIKKQKILFCTTVSKFQEISTLNICDGAKQIYPKKQKNLLRRDILRILVAVIPRFDVKKVSFFFKISPPVYLHVVKIDIIWWTAICLNLSKS